MIAVAGAMPTRVVQTKVESRTFTRAGAMLATKKGMIGIRRIASRKLNSP